MTFKPPWSRRAFGLAVVLVALHAAVLAYVESTPVYYDSRGLDGLSWWLGVTWLLPIGAVSALLISAVRHWMRRRED